MKYASLVVQGFFGGLSDAGFTGAKMKKILGGLGRRLTEKLENDPPNPNVTDGHVEEATGLGHLAHDVDHRKQDIQIIEFSPNFGYQASHIQTRPKNRIARKIVKLKAKSSLEKMPT